MSGYAGLDNVWKTLKNVAVLCCLSPTDSVFSKAFVLNTAFSAKRLLLDAQLSCCVTVKHNPTLETMHWMHNLWPKSTGNYKHSVLLKIQFLTPDCLDKFRLCLLVHSLLKTWWVLPYFWIVSGLWWQEKNTVYTTWLSFWQGAWNLSVLMII